MKLEKVIQHMGAASAELEPALNDREVNHFAIDSRDVQAGSLFFALSQPDYKNNGFNGDFDDATKFVRSAFENGAIAAVVRTERFDEHRADLSEFEDRIVKVEDVIRAFQDLAHGVYLEWNKPVIAITGSAGKTTAKEFTAHVLESSGRKVLRNIKNYNNGLGHPLTVLRLAEDPTYDVAVLEMGMSTPMNEIARLCRITPPDVSVVLNVLPVHVEHLGSIENVAKAKAEIVQGMKGTGTAVLNADDARAAAMSELSSGSILTYGIDAKADVYCSAVNSEGFSETVFELRTPSGSAEVTIPLSGRHNISNALAAAAVGHSFGMTAEEIGKGLSSISAPTQRGEILKFKAGFTVINDSYNSNPAALMSMVHSLVEGAAANCRKVVVAGEMLELGSEQESIHQRTGSELAASGIEILIGVRGLAEPMVESAKASGLNAADFAENSEVAGEMLVAEIRPGDVVLVKGSRGVRTEKVVEKLLEKFELEDGDAGMNKTS